MYPELILGSAKYLLHFRTRKYTHLIVVAGFIVASAGQIGVTETDVLLCCSLDRERSDDRAEEGFPLCASGSSNGVRRLMDGRSTVLQRRVFDGSAIAALHARESSTTNATILVA